MLTAKEVIANADKYCDGGSYYIDKWCVFIVETEEYGWVVDPEIDNNDGQSYWILYEVICEIKEFMEWLKGREE